MSEKNSQWSVWKECWKQRLLYIVAGIIALIGSSIISLSIPSTYHSYKQISIDANKYNILEKGNLSELIKKNKGLEPSTITTDPEIFALIIRSQVFLENLASVQLCFSNGKPNSTYGQHLKEAKQPWWNNLLKKKPYLELIQNNVKC